MPRTGKKNVVKSGKKTGKKPVEVSEESSTESLESLSESSPPKKKNQRPVKNTKKKIESSSESDSSESSVEIKKNPKKILKKPTKGKAKKAAQSESESEKFFDAESLSSSSDSVKVKKTLKKQPSKKKIIESSESEESEPAPKKQKKPLVADKKAEDARKAKESEEYKKRVSEFSEKVKEHYLSTISSALTMDAKTIFLQMPFHDFSSLVSLYIENLKTQKKEDLVVELRKKFGVFDIGPKPEDQDPYFKPMNEVKESRRESKIIDDELGTEKKEKAFRRIEKEMESEQEEKGSGEEDDEGTIEPIGEVEKNVKSVEEDPKLTDAEIEKLLTFSKKDYTDEQLAVRSGVDMKKVLYFQNNLDKIKKENPKIMARLNARTKLFI